MKGIVVCPQPRAADVGAEILSAGGNAFDAAVATAFAQMGVDPRHRAAPTAAPPRRRCTQARSTRIMGARLEVWRSGRRADGEEGGRSFARAQQRHNTSIPTRRKRTQRAAAVAELGQVFAQRLVARQRALRMKHRQQAQAPCPVVGSQLLEIRQAVAAAWTANGPPVHERQRAGGEVPRLSVMWIYCGQIQ